MLSRVSLGIIISTGALVVGFFVLTQSVHSNVVIQPTPNQTLPTILYNCVTHCSPQQNAFIDGYKMGADHAISHHLYGINCPRALYCDAYASGYRTGWDKYIWAAEHTCYHCA
jgi:hypothetical protein